jgi:hypothetical protein
VSPYVRPNIVVDEESIRQVVYTAISTAVPGWQPRSSSPTTAILEAFIRLITEQRAIFADVPDAIFVALGEKILGIPHLLATSATSTATFTLLTAAPVGGFLVPTGTDVGALAADGVTIVAFETTTDLVIAAGGTTGDVAIAALTPGVAGNDLSGDLELLDGLPGVAPTATLVTPTTGGTDEETLDVYLNRLVRRLALLNETPVTEAQVALFSEVRMEELGTPGRALAMDGYSASANTSGNIKTVSVALKDLSGAPLPSGTKTTIAAALQAARLQNYDFQVVDFLYTNLTIAVTVKKDPSALSSQVQADVQAAIAAFIDPANYASGHQEGDPSVVSRPIVKINDIIGVAFSVNGVQSVTSATLNGGSSDITMQSGKPHAIPAAVGSGSTVACTVT